MGSTAVEKTEEELRKEIDELHRQQREITERLRDPRGLRRGGFPGADPRNVAANGARQRGFVRPADRTDNEDQPPAKRRLLSAVVKVEDREIIEDAEAAKDVKTEDSLLEGDGVANQIDKKPSDWQQGSRPRRDFTRRAGKMEFDAPETEPLPRVLPKNEDPSLVNQNKRMSGQLLGTLESPNAPSQPESHGSETQPPDLQNILVEPQSEVEQSSTTRQNPDEDNWFLDDEGRKLIEPLGDSFKKATEVMRDLYNIVNDHWDGPHTCITGTPELTRKLWWLEFSQKYFWAPNYDGEVRRIFRKKVGDHMRNVMNKAKTKHKKPAWISHSSWEEIVRRWNCDKHKKSSQRNKQNRASSSKKSGTATYVGGSITIGEHKRKMAKALGSMPSISQTFEQTFMKKDKTFVSDRAKAIKEKFDEMMADSVGLEGTGSGDGEQGVDGTTKPSHAEQTKMWLEASCAVKQGKIYGLGSLARDYAKSVGVSTSGTASSRFDRHDSASSEEVSQLKIELAQRDNKIKFLEQNMQGMGKNIQVVMQHLNMLMQAQMGPSFHVQVDDQPLHDDPPPAPRATVIDLDGDQHDDLPG